MPDLSDAQKIEMAKKAAAIMFTSMVGIPQEVQLEASILLVKSLFMSSVKATHRISLFNSVVQRLRKQLQEHLKTGVVQ